MRYDSPNERLAYNYCAFRDTRLYHVKYTNKRKIQFTCSHKHRFSKHLHCHNKRTATLPHTLSTSCLPAASSWWRACKAAHQARSCRMSGNRGERLSYGLWYLNVMEKTLWVARSGSGQLTKDISKRRLNNADRDYKQVSKSTFKKFEPPYKM